MRWSCEPLVGGNWPSSLFTIWRELCQNKLFSSCLLWFTQVLPPHHNDHPPQLYCLCWSNLGQMAMKSWWKTWESPPRQATAMDNFSKFPLPLASGCLIVRPWRVPATRPDPNFFLLPEPDPKYFLKFPSLVFSPVGCFPAGRFKSFNNNPQILLFSSRSDTKSSVQLIYDALHFTSRIKLDQDLGWESF